MSDRGAETIAQLLSEIKAAHDEIMRADTERTRKIEAKCDRAELQKLSEEMSRKSAQLQAAMDSLALKVGRPGGSSGLDTAAMTLRQSARGLLQLNRTSYLSNR
jgi:hypothetical protein